MAGRPILGSFELMVLLAVIRLGEAAYGARIVRALEAGTGREVGVGSVYAALERLEGKGFVSSRLGDPTPERGGRAKRYFRATPEGVREARSTRETLSLLWQGLPQLERACT
ncbi:MAG: PadR family transcriptional regulator [Acidobacteria bacterium]|nr:PadR family transcriptional regulator [Acidobacteriota bacterium]